MNISHQIFRALVVTTTAVCLLTTSAAHAGGWSDKGKAAYKAGQYADAAKAYLKAYKAKRTAKNLYMVARSHHQAGLFAEASKYYTDYLAHKKATKKGKKLSREHLTTVKTKLAEAKLAAEAKRKADEAAKKAAEAKKAADAKAALTKQQATTSSGGPNPAGWALVGVGGAALVAGAVLMVLAAGQQSDIDAAKASAVDGRIDYQLHTQRELFDARDTMNTFNTAGVVSLAAGGAIAVAGIVIVVLTDTPEPAVRGDVKVSRHGMSFGAVGRF